MGFIFRTVFWLSLAIVLIPPEARLGGREIQSAGTALWSLGGSALNACETNPGLCKAATNLWTTTLRTTGELAADAQNQLEKSPPLALQGVEDEPRRSPKIQARVE
jgi:hypothetical protein